MKAFRSLAAVLALSLTGLTMPAYADRSTGSNNSGDPIYEVEAPPAFAMAGDLLIARPLLIGATVIGAGLFVVSLPFTAAGGGIKETGQALVVDPAKAAFVRCLGCTRTGYNNRD
ncbi:multidrug transporter [Pseudomonas sp. Marseille-QA0892]